MSAERVLRQAQLTIVSERLLEGSPAIKLHIVYVLPPLHLVLLSLENGNV